jgi:hypothetical protein
MSYYETIDEDLIRAKALLAKGRASEQDMPPGWDPRLRQVALQSGTIYGGDIYAAYKLLESLVAEVERLRSPTVKPSEPTCAACGQPEAHAFHAPRSLFGREMITHEFRER